MSFLEGSAYKRRLAAFGHADGKSPNLSAARSRITSGRNRYHTDRDSL